MDPRRATVQNGAGAVNGWGKRTKVCACRSDARRRLPLTVERGCHDMRVVVS